VNGDKKVVWEKRAEADLVGAPCLAGDRVFASAERRLLAFDPATGEPSGARHELPGNPVLGPVPGPRGTIFVPLEEGAVAIVDPRTRRVTPVKGVLEAAVSAAAGDARQALFGTQSGDLVALDETGKVVFRAFTDQQRPVLWIRATTYSVLFGDASMLYVLDRDGQELWRHPVEEGAPAVADERQVFQGSPEGLAAYDR
jgi:outer membrane protein assembly factor BamB